MSEDNRVQIPPPNDDEKKDAEPFEAVTQADEVPAEPVFATTDFWKAFFIAFGSIIFLMNLYPPVILIGPIICLVIWTERRKVNRPQALGLLFAAMIPIVVLLVAVGSCGIYLFS